MYYHSEQKQVLFFDLAKYMEDEILKKIEEQDKKLNEIYKSVEATRKYFLVALIITVVAIVLPLIGLMFIIPKFLDIYANIGI